MKISKFILSSLFLWANQVRAESADSNVLVLTAKDFDEQLKANPLILVEFYAPWCGHCKALAPEYEKAADQLLEDKVEAKLAKVDCTTEGDLCGKHGVQGYPTLKLFREGHATDYQKARKADALVAYMKKQVLPALSEVTAKSHDDFVKKDKVVVVGYFDGSDGKEYQLFKTVANKFRDDFLFGAVVDKKVATDKKVKQVPGIVLYKQFDEKKNVFPDNVEKDAKLTEENLSKFISVNSVPLMNDIGPDNYGKYVESGLPLFYLFVDTPESRKEAGEQVEPVAKKFRGKVNFVYIDATQFGGHAKNLNLKEDWPAAAIEEPAKHTKFPFDQSKPIKEEDVEKFVSDYLDGKIKPSVKSQPIPESNDEPVKVIVADNFKEVVMDKKKDVLIEFYAPWCGHCKRLAPIYDKLGKRFESISSVVIAKMDATENDVPHDLGFTVEGFPTIKLFKAEDNEIVDYSGERTEEGFIEFLKANAAKKFDLPEADDEKESESKEEKESESEDDGHDEL